MKLSSPLSFSSCFFFFKHYAICSFIVTRHLVAGCIFYRHWYCAAPDSLGEILVIFQSAAGFTIFLSSLFTILCYHVALVAEEILLKVTYFSSLRCKQADTVQSTFCCNVCHSSCITVLTPVSSMQMGKSMKFQWNRWGQHTRLMFHRPWNKKPYCSAGVVSQLCSINWYLETGHYVFSYCDH